MLDTLQKMSGTTHKVFKDSKSVTQDIERIWMQTEGKVTYNMNAKEVPVISYNDMAFISPQNSIVFRAGDSPVWNRNQTVLPMSWQLFANTIQQPGKKYTLQTIPTLSTAMDFDVRKNQPDFELMLKKRTAQARVSSQARDMYKKAYDYSDYDITQLDPDVYSDEVMELVNAIIKKNADDHGVDDDDEEFYTGDIPFETISNDEMMIARQEAERVREKRERKVYAGGNLSADDICPNGIPDHKWDDSFLKAYIDHRASMERDTGHFVVKDGSLCGTNGRVYIEKNDVSQNAAMIANAVKHEGNRMYSHGTLTEQDVKELGTYRVTDAFYRFLVDQRDWKSIADGRFESAMARELNGDT